MQPALEAFLCRDHPLLIGGKWRAPRGDARLSVENPATGSAIASVGSASSGDLDDAVAAAREALDGPWGSLNPADRAAMLFRLADLVATHAEELAQIETLENGLPITLATGTIRGFAPSSSDTTPAGLPRSMAKLCQRFPMAGKCSTGWSIRAASRLG